jgi:hypothetical protein
MKVVSKVLGIKVLLTLSLGLFLAGCRSSSSGGAAGQLSPGAEPCASISACSRVLAWDPVTTDITGGPLPEPASYSIHYGTTSGSYPYTVDVGTATTGTVTGLGAGTYYFVVTAYLPTSGVRSPRSNEVNDAVDLMRILRPISQSAEFSVTIEP